MELALITLGHFATAAWIIAVEIHISAEKNRIARRIERRLADALCLPV